MPNHVTNVVLVDKDFEQVVNYMKSSESDFDFNNLIPIPKELSLTSSPPRICKVEGAKETWDKEMTSFERQPQWFGGFSITEEQRKELLKKHGYDNWYDWCVDNWGTKWNAYNIVIVGDTSEIYFQTAWSHPYPILEALSKQFPTAGFSARYADENLGNNAAQYTIKNGEIDIMLDKTGDIPFCEEVTGLEAYYYDEDDYEEEDDYSND